MFIGTMGGSIMDYSLEDEPFTITLQQVHKNITKQMNQILFLSRSRQLAIIAESSIFLGDTSSQVMAAVPIGKLKGVTAMARSKFVQQHYDTLAVGLKRAIVVFQVTAYEVIEGSTISLPGTPLSIQFISPSRLIISAQRGVYLVDISDGSHHKLFSINDPLFQRSNYMVSALLNPFSRYYYFNV